MNILVSPYSRGHFYFRSDSTLIRMLTDFYAPDYVKSVFAVPVLCFRSMRSGKAVPARFAERYLGPFSCGILLRPVLSEGYTEEEDRVFVENALDYTTVIPYSLLPADRLRDFISAKRPFTIKINGITKVEITTVPESENIRTRFEEISRYSSLRTGDFIALELSEPVPVGSDEHLTARFGVEGNISFVVH